MESKTITQEELNEILEKLPEMLEKLRDEKERWLYYSSYCEPGYFRIEKEKNALEKVILELKSL